MTSPDTPDPDAAPPVHEDVQSDPAKGADDRTDWSDEGGATYEGAATDEEA